jgi:hypothetical protein
MGGWLVDSSTRYRKKDTGSYHPTPVCRSAKDSLSPSPCLGLQAAGCGVKWGYWWHNMINWGLTPGLCARQPH